VDRLKEICSKESVDVVFPASHEEGITFAKNRDVFEEIGTHIAISRHEVLELSFDKKRAFQRLKDRGLPCPDFRAVKSLVEFEDAAAELGIDRRKLVMKPVLTRGGRGAKILSKESVVHRLLGEKPGYLDANYGEVVAALSELSDEDFPELVLMQYLPGTIVSVDFLAKDGKALIVVPKVRVVGNPSQTIVGKVTRDALVEDATAKISEAFGFDYTINMEMGRDEEGVPLPFDFNPRIAASTAFCTAAGANLIYFALKMALGEPVPQVDVKDGVMMFRYFKELYVQPDSGAV
jgi:carbamoyl-phosphate synthase large subunit